MNTTSDPMLDALVDDIRKHQDVHRADSDTLVFCERLLGFIACYRLAALRNVTPWDDEVVTRGKVDYHGGQYWVQPKTEFIGYVVHANGKPGSVEGISSLGVAQKCRGAITSVQGEQPTEEPTA